MTPDDFMRRYEAATNAHDLAGTLELIAEDAVYLFSDRTSHIGKPAIKNALAANFASIRNETYAISGLRWLAASEAVAVCIYEFRWSGEINGEAASGSGRGTSVLRRDDGHWLVAHEHLSSGGLE
ncbi:SnoaL-like domain protein [Devosia sp. LC5]|uniref:YybH family protein n=1 Tax=Devosia sp. LC5 TaxID=1502724 RepID=UPI0004E31234|nr:nuclear transport factor 2 family protein [Devosia sp. LC5]KFC62481.1 SnoaL-like domain protein [Devosia sp. LC5]